MGDEGWANRGESPATLGAVGIAMRSAPQKPRCCRVVFSHIFGTMGCRILGDGLS